MLPLKILCVYFVHNIYCSIISYRSDWSAGEFHSLIHKPISCQHAITHAGYKQTLFPSTNRSLHFSGNHEKERGDLQIKHGRFRKPDVRSCVCDRIYLWVARACSAPATSGHTVAATTGIAYPFALYCVTSTFLPFSGSAFRPPCFTSTTCPLYSKTCIQDLPALCLPESSVARL